MTNGGQRPDPSGFRIENEMDLLFGRAHPNPTREGCPPPDLLKRLARRELPIGDPAYDHFAKCSPCYQELRAIQQADAARLAAQRRQRLMWAAAAVLIIALGGSWLAIRQTRDTSGTVVPTTGVEQQARLDLRPFTVTRGDERTKEPDALVLSRARLNLTMLLPVGFESGEYDVQVLDSNLASKASTTGSAEIREYVPTLQATLDSTHLAPGAYQLAVRRRGEDWRLFPITVK